MYKRKWGIDIGRKLDNVTGVDDRLNVDNNSDALRYALQKNPVIVRNKQSK